MKKLFISLFILTLISSIATAQSIPEILYYKFDRTDSIIINHASNATAATDTALIIGAQTQGSIGQCGHALVGIGTNGLTDYVNTGWTPNLSNGSWTISFWSNNIDTASTSNVYYLFGESNTASFRCFTNGLAGHGNWILRGAGLTDIYANGGASAGPALTTFTYDSLSSMSKSYVNGVLISSVVQAAANLTGTGVFKIGGYSSSAGLNNGGLLDEFRFYNRALSTSEILDLLNLHTSDSITLTECDSFVSPSGNHTWTSSGLYSDTIPNYLGCDSIISIDLTIISIDTSVTQLGMVLTSNDTSTTYQWVDCNNSYTAITGATSQVFTSTSDGNYAVVLSNGSCTDTSACYIINSTGVEENTFTISTIYPNPSNGKFVIESHIIASEIKIFDVAGNELMSFISQSEKTSIDMSMYPQGIYLIEVYTPNSRDYIKLLIIR